MNGKRNNIIEKNSLLGPCHRVETILGEGSFGVVAKCRDINTNEIVAIKVSKPDPKVFHQARIETENLKKLRHLDPETAHIISWQGFFFHERSICMTFELLDLSLYEYMRQRRYEDLCPGLPPTEVRAVVEQMSSALSHLSSVGIVHADIKPDNIMVVDRNEKPPKVKLIDFGLSFPLSECRAGKIAGTLMYMAPEIILGMPFNEAIDMWSLGQTVVELITGFPMYRSKWPYDVMKFIVETQGQPPDSLLDEGINTEQIFRKQTGCSPRWKFRTPEEMDNVVDETRKYRLTSLDGLLELMEWQRGQHEDHNVLLDLIKKMLCLDHRQRIKPLEVLQHPFLTGSPPQSSCAEVFDDTNNNEEVITEDQPAGPQEEEFRIQAASMSQAQDQEEGFMIPTESSCQPEEPEKLQEEDISLQTTSQVEEPENDGFEIQAEKMSLAEEPEDEGCLMETVNFSQPEEPEIEDGDIRIQMTLEPENEDFIIQIEEVQPERKEKRVGRFRRMLKRIRHAFRNLRWSRRGEEAI